MTEELNPQSGVAGAGRKRPTGEVQAQRVADREVPLGQHPDHTLPRTVHAWLDGELPEAAVRKSENPKDVEFWRGLDAEMARVRRMRTPSHVEAQIMAALPTHAPSLITPWYKREFVITPGMALLGALSLVAASALLTALVLK